MLVVPNGFEGANRGEHLHSVAPPEGARMPAEWTFDEDDIIDACLNEALMAEIGLSVLTRLIIVELRLVKRAPHIATHVHMIGTEAVYLRLIGKGWDNGRPRPGLVLTYTLDERVIQPLWVFKASEVYVEDDRAIADSGPLAPLRFDGGPHGKPSTDAPLPEKVEKRIARALSIARRRRKH